MQREHAYPTVPQEIPGMPPGIPFIVANEAAERFSYYGMRGILVAFMTKYLLDANGQLAPMSELDAKENFHLFASAVYFFPLFGAILSDWLLGKYRTILWLSVVYCLGHLVLAIDDTRWGLAAGLGLIAIGSGGIKPCVSAHVGDQFGAANQQLLPKVYGWFYFSINLGAFVSTLLTPWLLDRYGPHVAFGVPGILMLLATIFFWLGRNRFVHVPPGGNRFLRETFSLEGLTALGKLLLIYLFVAVFWSLYDQSSSSWVLQSGHMDRNWLGVDWLPSQVQAINPLLILLYIPLFSYAIYPAIEKVLKLNPLRKILIGFLLTALAFAVSAWIEQMIEAGQTPKIAWQLLAYAILTAAEVMVSITVLEFSYTQAPRAMKSMVMSLALFSVSIGNALTAAVNHVIRNADGSSKLPGASYYWFFVGLMLATAAVFLFVVATYREKTYLQDTDPLAKS